jgi:hypothetical protein
MSSGEKCRGVSAVLFTIANPEVQFTQEHARALVELLLPDIKRRMEKEEGEPFGQASRAA